VSALVGVLAGVLVLATLGMAAPASLAGNWGPKLGSVDVKLGAPGAQMIHILYPEEFTVPAGYVLVVTAVNSYPMHAFGLGAGVGGVPVRVEFDDKLVYYAGGGATSTEEVPVGLAAGEGVRVKLSPAQGLNPGDPPIGATLLGYLDIE
jgi:hypothetical protein